MAFIRNLIRILAVWLVIFLFFFAVGEACFRVFRKEHNALEKTTQKNNQSLFEPNGSMHSTSSIPGEFDYTARFNSFGYRGADFEVPKANDALRIFAIGDSFTFGVGASDTETIPAVLEKILKKDYPTVEVVNAGVGHASPVVYWANLQKIYLKHQPDLVVLFLDLTDLWDDWSWERHARRASNGTIDGFDMTYVNGKRDWWIWAVQHSAFCRYVHNRLVRTFEKISILGWKEYFALVAQGKRAKAAIATAMEGRAAKEAIRFDGLLMMRGKPKEADIRSNFERTASYLRKIHDALHAEGIPMVIVMYPHGIYVGANQWAEGRKFWGFEQGKRYTDPLAFDMVKAFAAKEKIAFVNTWPRFPVEPKEKYFFDWDGHLTPIGYKTVAEAVAASPEFKKVVAEIAQRNHIPGP